MLSEKEIANIRQGAKVTEAEWCRVFDWLGTYQFTQKSNVNFWYVKPFLCEDSLKVLSAHPGRWKPLVEIFDCLGQKSRLPFLLHCFQLRNALSSRELIALWENCLMRNSIVSTEFRNGHTGLCVQTGPDTDVFFSPWMKKADLANSILTEPLLVDNLAVMERFCQIRKPGWESLQYILGRKWRKPVLYDGMMEAIELHRTAEFGIKWDMFAMRRVSFALMAEVIDEAATGIFKYLLEKIPEKNTAMLEALSFHIVAHSSATTAPHLLRAIEAVHPGTLRQVHDYWGRNLLWYAIHNPDFAMSPRDRPFMAFLREAGCDTDNRNQLGLRWQEVFDWLTRKQGAQYR